LAGTYKHQTDGLAAKHQILIQYTQQGKPKKNAYVERFNPTVRYEWLSSYYLGSEEKFKTLQRDRCINIKINVQTWHLAALP
jgi:hypothetical protein